jgi:hypothetical protein
LSKKFWFWSIVKVCQEIYSLFKIFLISFFKFSVLSFFKRLIPLLTTGLEKNTPKIRSYFGPKMFQKIQDSNLKPRNENLWCEVRSLYFLEYFRFEIRSYFWHRAAMVNRNHFLEIIWLLGLGSIPGMANFFFYFFI